MPRSFDVSVDSPASVEQVHAAFSAEEYWLARLATLNGSTTLESLVVDDDQTVRVTTTQDLGRDLLPGIRREVLSPRSESPAHRDVETVGRSTPRRDHRRGVRSTGLGFGAASVAPTPNGSLLTLNCTVEFNVPLVGGTIESFIAREFAHGIPDIQDFTAKWVTEHA